MSDHASSRARAWSTVLVSGLSFTPFPAIEHRSRRLARCVEAFHPSIVPYILQCIIYETPSLPIPVYQHPITQPPPTPCHPPAAGPPAIAAAHQTPQSTSSSTSQEAALCYEPTMTATTALPPPAQAPLPATQAASSNKSSRASWTRTVRA